MKRIWVVCVVLALCAAMSVAQQQQQPQAPAPAPAAPAPPARTNVVERPAGPTYSDLYCAGFLTKQTISASNAVAGGVESPHGTQFSQGDTIFLEGSGYQEGARYSIVRELHDPNRYEPFAGQRAAVDAAGQPYADLGRVRVTAMRGNIAVALVEFSCAAISNGDLVIPFQEKPPLQYRGKTIFERFPAESGVKGRIVMAKDFDTVVGTGRKVYLNAGADKGVKIGDYFRAMRSYDPKRMDPVEAYSVKAPAGEDTQKHPKYLVSSDLQKLPRRNLGEMMVINVTPTSSTAIITYAVEPINIGDEIETDNSQPVPPPPPPQISCAANPATVARGGTVTITSTASSPEGRPLTYSYSASAGEISGSDATAILSTSSVQPGQITVTCNVADNRLPPLTASSTTAVTVEAPPVPAQTAAPAQQAPVQASKVNEANFKPNSARVDNVAKSILDDVALLMQRDADSKLVLIGESDPSERAKNLAAQRATNAKNYLVAEKGIDARRLETRTGTEGGRKVQIWIVPAGASFEAPGTNVIP